MRFEHIAHVPDALHDGGIVPEAVSVREKQNRVGLSAIELCQDLVRGDNRRRCHFAKQTRDLLLAGIVQANQATNGVPAYQRHVLVLESALHQCQAAFGIRRTNRNNRSRDATRGPKLLNKVVGSTSHKCLLKKMPGSHAVRLLRSGTVG
jgi:hypothetical protein